MVQKRERRRSQLSHGRGPHGRALGAFLAGPSLLMRRDGVRAHVKAAQASLERAAEALEAQPSNPSSGLDFAREQLLILRRRNASFPAGMFGDYRWPMLLVLYIAHEEGREMRQLDAFSESGVPYTTGKRILDELGSLGMILVRQGDHHRSRRLVCLSAESVEQMGRFLRGGFA